MKIDEVKKVAVLKHKIIKKIRLLDHMAG